MTWNYRVIRFVDSDRRESFRIHEVYYEDDKIISVSDVPASPSGETIPDLEEDVRRIKEALEKPSLKYTEI